MADFKNEYVILTSKDLGNLSQQVMDALNAGAELAGNFVIASVPDSDEGKTLLYAQPVIYNKQEVIKKGNGSSPLPR